MTQQDNSQRVRDTYLLPRFRAPRHELNFAGKVESDENRHCVRPAGVPPLPSPRTRPATGAAR